MTRCVDLGLRTSLSWALTVGFFQKSGVGGVAHSQALGVACSKGRGLSCRWPGRFTVHLGGKLKLDVIRLADLTHLEGGGALFISGGASHWRVCHSADIPSTSPLKLLLKGEGGEGRRGEQNDRLYVHAR